MKTILKLALAGTMLMPAAALAQDTVELTLWHMEQPPHRVARVQELIDAFNAANPGIVVKQEPQNWGEVYARARTCCSRSPISRRSSRISAR